jgi:Xaa-Pro aminopeptidase
MITAEGCRQRRLRLWENLDVKPPSDHLRFTDPIHLAWLANFHVDPISSSADFGGFLTVRKDGHALLIHDSRLEASGVRAFVDERKVIPWYDGHSPDHVPRQLAALAGVNPEGVGLRFHDRPGDPYASALVGKLTYLRRQKDVDEVEVLRRCCRATDAGHAWARANIKPGMTELDVYCGVQAACTKAAGLPVIVYGDFTVCFGPGKHGGEPTSHVLEPGDSFILDFSVVIGGYRSDFTNTLIVGKQPSPDQQRVFDLSCAALAAGEKELRAGVACQAVYDSVVSVFKQAGVQQYFPSHAGHGLGLTHPDAPFIVQHSDETLLAGDVVTIEPGLYLPNLGGVRVEHNYLITETGAERLSNHVLSLV